MLTLALGIGANAAIFTLVNAVLIKNLPVADPKALVRIGDNNDCCVNSGTHSDGDYSLFPTGTWQLVKKNVPEFEELAAMQAGSTVVEVKGSHAVYVSQPEAVVHLIEQAATSALAAGQEEAAAGVLAAAK